MRREEGNAEGLEAVVIVLLEVSMEVEISIILSGRWHAL